MRFSLLIPWTRINNSFGFGSIFPLFLSNSSSKILLTVSSLFFFSLHLHLKITIMEMFSQNKRKDRCLVLILVMVLQDTMRSCEAKLVILIVVPSVLFSYKTCFLHTCPTFSEVPSNKSALVSPSLAPPPPMGRGSQQSSGQKIIC